MDGDVTPSSHLFMVRLWMENLGDGKIEWRGKVQHVLSGQVHYFRDWETLVQFIQTTLPKTTNDEQPAHLGEQNKRKGDEK